MRNPTNEEIQAGAKIVNENFDELYPILIQYAKKINGQYKRTSVEELINIGYIKMCICARKFKDSGGASLKTYLRRYLCQSMISAIHAQSSYWPFTGKANWKEFDGWVCSWEYTYDNENFKY